MHPEAKLPKLRASVSLLQAVWLWASELPFLCFSAPSIGELDTWGMFPVCHTASL